MLTYEIKDLNDKFIALATTYTEALETADALSRAREETLKVLFNEAEVYRTTTSQVLFG